MTHDAASRTIVSLAPEIEKRGAESVLIEYAERENLPPAQLEKLAQVFNTLLTVDHIDKTAADADRGVSFPLVDVPILVVDYVTRTKQTKSAAPISARVSSHDPSTVDLLSAVRFDVQQVKAASAPVAEVVRYDANFISAHALDLQIDALTAMEKIAGALWVALPKRNDGSLDMSTAVADARPHCNDMALNQSLAWLKSASTVSLHCAELPAGTTKRAFAITGDAGRLLVEFNEARTTYRLMRKLATITRDRGILPEDLTDEEFDQHMRNIGLDPAALEDDALEDDTLEDEPPTPSFVTTATPADGSGPPKPPNPPKDGHTSTTASVPGTSRVSKVLNAIGAPIRGAGVVVSNAARAATDKIDQITSKERHNKDQQRSDTDVEDVRRAIGIRRLIGTDPVLKDSDPREVLEIYNAVARTNPEIVSNMPALRLLLREAVSYEGLTLDSQKQLTDIRSGVSKSEGQEADNLKRRYAINGSDKSTQSK